MMKIATLRSDATLRSRWHNVIALSAVAVFAGRLEAASATAQPAPANRAAAAVPAPAGPSVSILRWDSDAMLAARAWLNEYFRRSKRHSSEYAAAYMQRLSELPSDELRVWFSQFQQMRQRQMQEYHAARRLRNWQLQDARSRAAAVPSGGRHVAAGRRHHGWYAQQRANQAAQHQRALARRYAQNRQFTELYTPETYQVLHLLNYLDLQDLKHDLRERSDQ